MPANLTPEYKAAEAAFRKARDHRERLRLLREMLRVIPKHKGTDHLQGDIDIPFQLVDLPAVSPEHPVTWLGSTLVVGRAWRASLVRACRGRNRLALSLPQPPPGQSWRSRRRWLLHR